MALVIAVLCACELRGRSSLAAQGANGCALPYEARPGTTGYQKRDYGCEGYYVQPQAASLNVEVLSLVRGGISFGDQDRVQLAIPRLSAGLRESATIFGTGLVPGLNWALDGVARPDAPMNWVLSTVVRRDSLPPQNIGLMATARRQSGMGAPVFVAVEIRDPSRGAANSSAQRTTTLVFRVPLAGIAEWRVAPGTAWKRAEALDGDGRFSCTLPESVRGEVDVEVRWARRGSRTFGATEALRLLLW